jgi:adenine phosphoribosyltransferase
MSAHADRSDESSAIRSRIRTIPDYPKKGIMFRDVTTLLKDAEGFRLMLDGFTRRYRAGTVPVDVVAGIEARGFVVGGALAAALDKGFVPIRKAGKLPAATVTQEYALEYGTDRIQIHQDAFPAGTRVLLVDDLLATGGTALAAAALIEKLGGSVTEIAFIVSLPDVGGAKRLRDKGYRTFFLTEFEGE